MAESTKAPRTPTDDCTHAAPRRRLVVTVDYDWEDGRGVERAIDVLKRMLPKSIRECPRTYALPNAEGIGSMGGHPDHITDFTWTDTRVAPRQIRKGEYVPYYARPLNGSNPPTAEQPAGHYDADGVYHPRGPE